MILFASLMVMAFVVQGQGQDQTVENLQDQVMAMQEKVEELTRILTSVARQSMVQQFMAEEKVRSDGSSGIMLTRGINKGPDNYYSSTHIASSSYMSMHDHANYARTVGMGEISVVLNGVAFRTRHNDYKLKMASTTSSDYHATEDVPFPPVPEDVTKLDNLQDQIAEMKEWFKAFNTQNTTHRDYKNHFRPVLCYLEGTWTLDKKLAESFESDRHHLAANSWYELMENVRYSAYTGTKNRDENFAVLPTTIMSVNTTSGLPNIAQWNYRILCNPLKEDLPLKYLKRADDLSYRHPRRKEGDDVLKTRAARFKIYEHDSPKFTKYSLIDRLMGSIPGKDNGLADLAETSFGDSLYQFDDPSKILNTGFYHRWFKFGQEGANGLTSVARGFNDDNCWIAKNTQTRVAPMSVETCKKKVCHSYSSRVSFAIPLEIIYLTPLLSWNPYKITIHPKFGDSKIGGGRGTLAKPYNGIDEANYYMTPVEFFAGDKEEGDPADTVKNSVHVLDSEGVNRRTVASGNFITLREIQGVGRVRQRYPIAPVYGEGSSVWKELNALKDLIFTKGVSGSAPNDDGDDDDQAEEDENDEEEELPEIIDFETSPTNKPNFHYHSFSLSRKDYLALKNDGVQLSLTTDVAEGHSHDLVIRYNAKRGFEYSRCDGKFKCWDKHPRRLVGLREATPL